MDTGSTTQHPRAADLSRRTSVDEVKTAPLVNAEASSLRKPQAVELTSMWMSSPRHLGAGRPSLDQVGELAPWLNAHGVNAKEAS
jgi:hypothetical protein